MAECLTKDYFKVAVKIIFFILLLVFLYFIRDIVLMLLVSIVLAAIFIPVVDYLEKKRVSRLLSTLFIYLLGLLLAVGMIFVVVPLFSEQGSVIIQRISSFYQGIVGFFGSGQKILPLNLTQIPGFGDSLTFLGHGVFSFLGGLVGGIFAFVLIIILSFYIVIEKNNLIKFIISLFPLRYREFVSRMFVLTQEDLSAWGNGMLLMMVSVGILTYIGLLILGTRFALALAIFAGLTEVVPWIGPVIGAVPAVLLALIDSPVKALTMVVLYILVQQLENNIIVPQVMKRAVGLNPIVVITVLLIGAKIGGILGAIIAVPATAIISVFVKEYLKLKEQLKIEEEK